MGGGETYSQGRGRGDGREERGGREPELNF